MCPPEFPQNIVLSETSVTCHGRRNVLATTKDPDHPNTI